MSTALTPTGQNPLPERFANPLEQIRGFLGQPAVRRALPMILMLSLIGAAALAWMSFSTPTQKVLFANLSDADKSAVSSALTAGNIQSNVDNAGQLTVAEEDYSKARMLLAGQDLPKATPGGYQILDNLPMGVSRAVEGERLRQARETELARSIQEIDTVAEARVHLAMPESSVFVRDNAAPSASVIVKLNAGRTLSDAQVRSIINLVASSVPGMKPDGVTVVDQAGALLSKSANGDDGSADNDKRIDFQRRIEQKYREQLTQLLTPLVGAGNFSTEVQAEVDLDETQATRETYDKQGALRAEQGNWSGNQPAGGNQPGGIPGALSNTPPPAATAQAAGTNTPPQGASTAGRAIADGQKQSDQFARSYDLGKEISVTRNAPGQIKRLSVAVLLRDPDKGRRTQLEIQQVTDLVRAAVGFDQSRNDVVTVISKKFAGTDAAMTGPSWYDNAWLPIIARNVTAVLIALLVLIMGVRPLSKALLKKREDSGNRPAFAGESAAPSAAVEKMAGALSYDERVGAVRGFTRDNPAQAAAAIREMIRS